jgi:hypothetical protein
MVSLVSTVTVAGTSDNFVAVRVAETVTCSGSATAAGAMEIVASAAGTERIHDIQLSQCESTANKNDSH